jgi:DHA1 family multidrug resistance protein-like MFS transporter
MRKSSGGSAEPGACLCCVPHLFRWRSYFLSLISFPHLGQTGMPAAVTRDGIRFSPRSYREARLYSAGRTVAPRKLFKELSELRQITNFRRVILPVSSAFFIYTFGWGVTSPIFSIYVNHVTGNAFLTGLVLSVTTMAGVFLNIPFGIIEDRMNMKRVLQLVLLFYAALALLYPQANSVTSLLALSVGRGVASSFLWLTSWAYIFSFTEKASKGKETGFFSDMNDLASAVSPIVGGLVSVVSFFFPFYILSGASFAAFVVVTIFLKESPVPDKASLKLQLEKLSGYMKESRFLKTVFLIVVFYALINVYYSFLSVFLNDEGISVPLIGVILTVALVPAVSLEVPFGHLVDRHGIRRILSVAVLLTTVAAVTIPLSPNFYYAAVAVAAFTVSYTMIFIALYSRMSDIMLQEKVAMTGAIATFKDLGYTLGPLLAGLMIETIGMADTFYIVGAGFVVLLPVALTLRD